MSVITHRHLYCDLCDEPFQGCILGADAIVDQRKDAKAHKGWISLMVDRKKYDVCGGCVDERDKQKVRQSLREKVARPTATGKGRGKKR